VLLLVRAMVSLSRSELRWGLVNIAAAVALLTIALPAIALYFFRRRPRELTLTSFGRFFFDTGGGPFSSLRRFAVWTEPEPPCSA
jgi:hypothetical protein